MVDTNHKSGEIVLVLFSLSTQIFEVQIAVSVGLDGHYLEPCHYRRLHTR